MEAVVDEGIDQELEGLQQVRLLIDASNLLESMNEHGDIPITVEVDTKTNLFTAVYETAMPGAVSVTHHMVETVTDQDERERKIIKYLGRSSIEFALNGLKFHRSSEAHRRVYIEADAAEFDETHLRPGVALPFISPKMTRKDASSEVAKQEHLYNDDSIRVSFPVTNHEGKVVVRRLESLLVEGVPHEAWVSMLSDPDNIFGKAFEIDDPDSAIPIMEMFDQMEIAEELLPEGPITFVAEVLKYIDDPDAIATVEEQLTSFRNNQEKHRMQAEAAAEEWYGFEVELARSIKVGQASFPIKRFIHSLSDNWNEDDLRLINEHQTVDGEFVMSDELAAKLEHTKRYVINGAVAVAADNKKVLEQLDPATISEVQALQTTVEFHRLNKSMTPDIYRLEAILDRKLASNNLTLGGGCPGEIVGNFISILNIDGSEKGSEDFTNWGNKKSREYNKKGICVTPGCPSPKPTKLGPCNVCEGCQDIYDEGEDPAKEYSSSKAA